jgi:hypothetical protein
MLMDCERMKSILPLDVLFEELEYRKVREQRVGLSAKFEGNWNCFDVKHTRH